MEELEARRPTDTRDKTKVHEKVTIKQTLEGFHVFFLFNLMEKKLKLVLVFIVSI